jgi:Fe-S cluster assembly ATPase SufC
LALAADERARAGVFLAFQYPVEIPGVNNMYFLRTALNAVRRVVSDGVNRLRDTNRAIVMTTHYQRLLDYIVPDYVHVLSEGRIVVSGDKTLAMELERSGYAQYS